MPSCTVMALSAPGRPTILLPPRSKQHAPSTSRLGSVDPGVGMVVPAHHVTEYLLRIPGRDPASDPEEGKRQW